MTARWRSDCICTRNTKETGTNPWRSLYNRYLDHRSIVDAICISVRNRSLLDNDSLWIFRKSLREWLARSSWCWLRLISCRPNWRPNTVWRFESCSRKHLPWKDRGMLKMVCGDHQIRHKLGRCASGALVFFASHRCYSTCVLDPVQNVLVHLLVICRVYNTVSLLLI